MNDNLGRHRVGEPEIIGGSQPVDQHPDLVAPRDRVDHRAGIGRIELSGQAIARGLIVKPAVDAAQLAGGHQPLERLVDSDPRAEIERSEEHTSELQSLMRISYADFCLKKTKIKK